MQYLAKPKDLNMYCCEMRIETVGQQTIHSVKSLFQKVRCCAVVFCDNGDRPVARAMAGDHDLSEAGVTYFIFVEYGL